MKELTWSIIEFAKHHKLDLTNDWIYDRVMLQLHYGIEEGLKARIKDYIKETK